MVVLAIIGIISVVTLNSQSSFNKALVLANTTYDIALAIRSAETFGIGSRASGSIANAGYGVHFARGTANSFILFPDISPINSSCTTPDCKPGNYVYDAVADAPVQTYTLGNGMTISNFCVVAGVPSCENTNGETLDSLDIVFSRPNPDSFMSTNGFYSALTTKTQGIMILSLIPAG